MTTLLPHLRRAAFVASLSLTLLMGCSEQPAKPSSKWTPGDIVSVKLTGERLSVVHVHTYRNSIYYTVRNHEGHMRSMLQEELKAEPHKYP